jgi:hypothetical protein
MPRVLVSRAAFAVSVCAAVAVAACDYDASPSRTSPVGFTASIDRSVIPAGETAVVTFRLENRTSDALVLRFSSACQILPFIRESGTNRTVYPDSGWVCAQALSTLELAPGEVVSREVTVEAGVTTAAGVVPLGPGSYIAVATLGESGVEAEYAGRTVTLTGEQRRSTAAPFTVQ